MCYGSMLKNRQQISVSIFTFQKAENLLFNQALLRQHNRGLQFPYNFSVINFQNTIFFQQCADDDYYFS